MVDDGSGTTNRIQGSLIRLAQGDESARDDLFAFARSRLTSLAHLMRGDFRSVGMLEDSDDVCQGACIRLNRALIALKPTCAVDFFRLAALQIRRELIDLARAWIRRNERLHGIDVSPGEAVDSGPSLVDLVEESADSPSQLAMWSEFHAIVERLPELERLAFELSWYHGLTQIEAAMIMGISERQFRRHFAAARLRLADVSPKFILNPPENDGR
jgi:RNA polymerase sigma-70 factor (ECF subfamily)